jgi:hypothetical protein
MLTRRLFLAGAVAAPAIVRAESLMKLWVPPERKVWVGEAIRGDVELVSGNPGFYWMGLDFNPDGNTTVISLYRNGELLEVLPAPALCNGDVLRLTVNNRHASVSVRR